MSFYVNFLSSPLSDEQLLGTIDLMIFLVHVFSQGFVLLPAGYSSFLGGPVPPCGPILR